MFLLRLLRRIGVVLAVLSLLFVAFATVVRWRGARALERAVKDFETRVGPVNLAAYKLPPVNPETNPAPAFRRASELLEDAWWSTQRNAQSPPSSRVRKLADRIPSEWTAAERADLETLLELAKPAREELRRSLERRGPSSFELDFTSAWLDFKAVSALGDLLMIEARHAEAEKNWNAVQSIADDFGRLASLMRTENALIFQFIALNFERRQHLILRMIAEAPEADLATIEVAARSLGESAPVAGFLRAIGSEGAFFHNAATRADLRPYVAISPVSHVLLWLSADTHVASYLRFYADSSEVLRDQAHATAVWPAPPKPGLLWSADLDGFRVLFEPLSARLAATRATGQLARAALELRRAALTSGSYPAATDPRPSELTGKPMRRRETSDGGMVLDFEGAQELWERWLPPNPATPPLVAFEWRLPGGRRGR